MTQNKAILPFVLVVLALGAAPAWAQPAARAISDGPMAKIEALPASAAFGSLSPRPGLSTLTVQASAGATLELEAPTRRSTRERRAPETFVPGRSDTPRQPPSHPELRDGDGNEPPEGTGMGARLPRKPKTPLSGRLAAPRVIREKATADTDVRAIGNYIDRLFDKRKVAEPELVGAF